MTNEEEKYYRFRFTIETEDGEVLEEGSTFLNPSSISEYGECESVDQETGKYLRIFKKRLVKEAEQEEERKREDMEEVESTFTSEKDAETRDPDSTKYL